MRKISILDFFKTGKFGYVKLGFSKSQVIYFIGKNTKIYYSKQIQEELEKREYYFYNQRKQ